MSVVAPSATPVLDVVIPVYNEEHDLEPCVRRLCGYLDLHFPYRYRVTIADNASVDDTPKIAQALAEELRHVTAVRLDGKGRGRALNSVWSASDATVLAYMDVDLSTDLNGLFPLVAPLISGHSDLAIGSRLARGSRVVRGPKREFISRCYNLILRASLAASFSDAQCGFKAIRADVAGHLLPLVVDTGWFFDTELLVLAQRTGLRIHEVPVDWVDDPDSRVDIVSTAIADLKGVWRLGRAFAAGVLPISELRAQFGRATLEPATPGVPPGMTRQAVRFAAIGVVSTLAYLLLFALLRLGTGVQLANFLALLVTAVANTTANRRLTFGVRGRDGMGRHQFLGLLVFALGWALTSGSLAVLNMVEPNPARWRELGALVLANLAATVVRFVLLRVWVFHRR
jgi:putative flippase GtrA